MTAAGEQMYALVERLYPLCRSITGDGVRATLEIVDEYVPLQVHEVPTGTQVLDWTVPQEWNIRDAYVADAAGHRVVDFAASSLHVLGYSVPVSATMPLAELRGHLHTLPDHPGWVPYRTSYYKPEWGFCLAQETLDAMPDGDYEVRIDSTLADGHLTYAEHVVPGQVPDEVIVSSHVCHPSLANDNLAGIAVAAFLARALAEQTPYYTYRFIFAPGTIGAITWLARNAERVERVKHGLVLACAGDPGRLTYKQSRRGDAEIDRVMRHVLPASERPHHITEFTPYGYDERQYCSPGSTSAWARSAGPRTPAIPSTTPRRTTWTSSPRRRWRTRSRSAARPSPSSTATGGTSISAPTASRSWAGVGCTRRSAAAATPSRPRWPCSGCSTSRTASTVCWTSPSGPGCRSAPSPPRPTPCTVPG